MNPRITDLLDDYVDTSVRLFPPEQVLRSNNSDKTPPPASKPVRHRMKKPLVIAAGLLLALTGIAVTSLTISRNSTGSSLNSSTPDTTQWSTRENTDSYKQYARAYGFDAVPDHATLLSYIDLPMADSTDNRLLALAYDVDTATYALVFQSNQLTNTTQADITTAQSPELSDSYQSTILPGFQEFLQNAYFIYRDGSQSALHADGQVHHLSSDVFAVRLDAAASQSDDYPAYVEIDGTAYPFSLSGASFDTTALRADLHSFTAFNQDVPSDGQNELWLDPITGQYSWVMENTNLHAALLAVSPSGSYEEALNDPDFVQKVQTFQSAQEAAFLDSCTLIYSDDTALPLTSDFSWSYENGCFRGSNTLAQCADTAGITLSDASPAYLIINGSIISLTDNQQGDKDISVQTDQNAQDIVLDDSNSVIVTSEATGLSMRVPTEFQDGLTTDQSVTLTAGAGTIEEQQYSYDGIFAFYDTSNQSRYDGLVFTIEAWDQSEFDSYLSDNFHHLTFAFNHAVVGKQGDTYYSMLQFGNIPTTIFSLFDSTSLDSAAEYNQRLQYVIPMVRSFIELNNLESAETDLDTWDELFRQRMLEPMEQLIQEHESAPAQTETAANKLDLAPADHLHSTQPVGEDDGQSSTLTSSGTGLILNVTNDCEEAGELHVDDFISLKNSTDGTSWDIDVVFAAFDQSNVDFGGFLWAVVASSPEQLLTELPEGYLCDVIGHQDGAAYSILMPASDHPQYNKNSYSSVMSYSEHANAFNWSLHQIITALTTSADEQAWMEDYQAQVLDPVANRFAQLEKARQSSIQPTDESLSLPAAQDTDADGLLTAELNRSVETEYGTAVIQNFTLDPSSGQFTWYTDLSGLVGPFTAYSSNTAAARENDEFQAALISVSNALQEAIMDSLLVYPDGSYLPLSTGEQVSYENHVFRFHDTLGLATEQPASDESPSCLEVGGTTYRFT